VTVPAIRRLALAAIAGGVTVGAERLLTAHPPGGLARWVRTNYRKRDVDLLGGPAAAAGMSAAAVALASTAPGLAAAAGGGAVLGLYDDLAGHTHARGLRGHVAALRSGTVTSGLVKMAGLVASGVLASRLGGARRGLATDVVLVAGTANLVNLLDLRPGRALKVVLLVATPLALTDGGDGGSSAAAAVAGVSIALLPSDLGERHMLGDGGANALGAALGWTLASRLSSRGRALAAGVVVGLTLVSERVSFSRVIAGHPVLAAVDEWGRRTT